MKKLINRIIAATGYEIIRTKRLSRLTANASDLKTLETDINALMDGLLLNHASGLSGKAQLRQDVFVLIETGFKKNGFFVELGATNGVDLSNTWLLEKGFGWSGILAEPAKAWHRDLKRNRSARIETDSVWKATGKSIEFNESALPEFSTFSKFTSADAHENRRADGKRYQVMTVSLLDLLIRHDAPTFIDYLSVDTEGSEYDILQAFDFSKYKFGVITVEHNFGENREKIEKLLSSNGYQRKFSRISKWDDWYFSI